MLVITKGLKDLLIGNQSCLRIFDLNIKQLSQLYAAVLEVDERVTLMGFTTDLKQTKTPCSSTGMEMSSVGIAGQDGMGRVQ